MSEELIHNEPEDLTLSQEILNSGGISNKSLIITPIKEKASEENLEILKDLPNLDISFKLTSDQASKVVSLKDVEKQILESDNIDLLRADVVNESYGDLMYKSKLPRSGFTAIPTKVNFKETKEFMASQISLEEQTLVDLFKAYIDEPYKQGITLLDAIKSNYYPGLLRIQESLVSELKNNREKINNNPNTAVPVEAGQFVNMAKADLLTVDFTGVRTELKTLRIFKEAVESVKAVFKHTDAFTFIRALTDYSPDQTSINMVELTEFILHPDYCKLLESYVVDCEQAAVTVGDVVKQAEAVSHKPDQIAELVIKNTELFLMFHKKLSKTAVTLYCLTLLNLAIKQMLVTYYEL